MPRVTVVARVSIGHTLARVCLSHLLVIVLLDVVHFESNYVCAAAREKLPAAAIRPTGSVQREVRHFTFRPLL
jgi:hypothetical protein